MCMTDRGTLTLAGLLQDPLTRLLMQSDGVTEEEFAQLLHRVQDCLLAREADEPADPPRRWPHS